MPMTRPISRPIGRRALLAGLGAGLASPALANAPLVSIRPVPRGTDARLQNLPGAGEIVAGARLGGTTGFAVADASTGAILEAMEGDTRLPPASTAKAMTAIYALDKLGPQHRFSTQVVATGPIRDGRLDGDLVLVGGGDPLLDTNHLDALAAGVKEAGIFEVAGRFLIDAGILPRVERIDPEQPDHVGYNPAISGLCLNFNRVHFQWKREGGRYDVSLDAPSGRFRPAVTVAEMEVVDRRMPVYTYEDAGAVDRWTVARGALGSSGARWLPVREPALYAADVFRTLMRAHGIVLPPAEFADGPVTGEVLARHESADLRGILRGMLLYSTNITAEVVGLQASATAGPVADLPASAGRMNAWLASERGAHAPGFVDHSGLAGDSRISASDMVRALVASGPDGPLRPILKSIAFAEAPRGQKVAAKTGTLNFVSGLAGFVETPGGGRLAFAIHSGDLDRRAALSRAERDRPDGARSWNTRAKVLQRRLIERWSLIYGTA